MFTETQIAQWRNDIDQLLKQPQPFANWLYSHCNCVVGRAYTVTTCPIQQFLADQAPWLDACVGKHQIYCDLGQDLCQQHGWLSPAYAYIHTSCLYYYGSPDTPAVPDWVSRFIAALDRQFCIASPACCLADHRVVEVNYNSYVTGAEALKLLARVAPIILVTGCHGDDFEGCSQGVYDNRSQAKL